MYCYFLHCPGRAQYTAITMTSHGYTFMVELADYKQCPFQYQLLKHVHIFGVF